MFQWQEIPRSLVNTQYTQYRVEAGTNFSELAIIEEHQAAIKTEIIQIGLKPDLP